MFDFSFFELVVVFVVALVVLGPTRLPGLVRKVGRWVGKARAMARDFQTQLENEVNLEELNRMTENLTREASATKASPPPEAFGDTPVTQPETAQPGTVQPAADSGVDNLAASGYPYGAQESDPATLSDTPPDTTPQPGDDTYSHAHAHGGAPMAEETAVETPDTNQQKDTGAA